MYNSGSIYLRRRKMNIKKTKYHKPLMILFVVYLLAMTWIILFKMQFSINTMDNGRSINLIPFHDSVIINGHVDISEIIWNALIFIPCGIYFCSLFKNWSFLKKLLVFIGISLFYEVFQFILAIGRSDITDVIENTLGGIIGIGVYIIMSKIFKTEEKTLKFITICAALATVLMIIFLAILFLANA
ncbi:hypothetical protein CTC_01412 [Clostridium tetani E88]|uniref:VanZ-like domain-containing protein n=2 Tax=Clostridium tetani TaxID=1513 RepID=Q894X2_CLOTE|nr:hypothetical protein CTC_01412 [Clostridium tetani E88]